MMQQTPSTPTSAAHWKMAAVFAIACVAIILALYYQTTLSTVAIWERSETFAHGFLIFPISAYLIWLQRHTLARIPPQPDWRGLAALAVLGFGWLFADAGSVLVVAQYCLVAMIPATVWTVLGGQATRAIAFPLGFLLLAVPTGEFLIPHLMNFTADFVVAALQLIGMPVYREGTFFTIPSGQWSVVEGCSGLRYLIASFTLGTLYAYLTYRSTKRRLIFSALSLIVPIIANGLRAFMIVMIAHLSDMKLALGVDHLIYGWVFFGIVMLLLFWIGAYWREDHQEPETGSVSQSALTSAIPANPQSLALTSLMVVALVALWPAYASYLNHRPISPTPLTITLPDTMNGWIMQETPLSDWQPHYVGPDATTTQTYRKNDMTVTITLAYYRTQRQDAELINSQNYMVQQKHPVWQNVGESARIAALAGSNVTVLQTRLRAPELRLLAWQWNRLAGFDTTNPYLAKLMLAKSRVLGQADDGTAIILGTRLEDTGELAAKTLQTFIDDTLPVIGQRISETSRQAAGGQ